MLFWTCKLLAATCIILLNAATWTLGAEIGEVCYHNDSCQQKFQNYFGACLGRYCGRSTKSVNGYEAVSLGDCESCPWGYRTDHYACVPCENTLPLYSILYLFLFTSLVWLTHLGVIVSTVPYEKRAYMMICCTLEVLVSILLPVFLFRPAFSFTLYACDIESVKDWYTIFYNIDGYHCASEAAYPMWSLLLAFMAVGTLSALLFRSLVAHYLCNKATQCVYFALYFYPTLALVQIIFGGLLYYSLPYIVLLGTVAMDISVYVQKKGKVFRTPALLVQQVVRYLVGAFSIVCLIAYFEAHWAWIVCALLTPTLVTVFFKAIYFLIQKLKR